MNAVFAHRRPAKLLTVFALFLIILSGNRAASAGAAFAAPQKSASAVWREPKASPNAPAPLAPVAFTEAEGRGFLVEAWMNGRGPYRFILDTGADTTIVTRQVARDARLSVRSDLPVAIGGLSGGARITGYEASVASLALGEAENRLPGAASVLVVERLAPDVDGVLDPTDAFFPLGYVIDIPRRTLHTFNPRLTPVSRKNAPPPGGAIVAWLANAGDRRPYVQLDIGCRALIDTGSGLGLALHETRARRSGVTFPKTPRESERGGVRDVSGNRIAVQRAAPLTVAIETLELRRVPTDVVFGGNAAVGALLGRSALRPFRLTFDPINRLIELAPTMSPRR
jgi:predicted aspartyl protease